MDIVAQNKKAQFNYFLLDKFEAGIVLVGSEIKSLREHKCSLVDSFVSIIDNEVYLKNCEIANFKNIATAFKPDPKRERKLLLNKDEIKKLKKAHSEKGLTIIPTKIYFNNKGLVKVEIAVSKGKHTYDKKETLKNKVLDIDAKRAMKSIKNLA